MPRVVKLPSDSRYRSLGYEKGVDTPYHNQGTLFRHGNG